MAAVTRWNRALLRHRVLRHRVLRHRVLLPVGVAFAVVTAGCAAGASGPARGGSPTPTATAPPAATQAPGLDVDPAVGVATDPVLPHVELVRSEFEGFATYVYSPPAPVGVVYFFHGSGGSAEFVNRLEATDVVNELTDRGYAVVSTESTQRTDMQQWNVADPSSETNADLARMRRLRQHVVATTTVEPSTPTFGIGMSNGSAFTALWAATSTKAGEPVAAVGLYMAGLTPAVEVNGGLRVPTFMVVAENETITNPAKMRAELASVASAGVPTEFHEVPERAALAARYLRVPGVDQGLAEEVVAAYRAAGVVDQAGRLVVELPSDSVAFATQNPIATVELPSRLAPGQRQRVVGETLAAIGAHQFNAEFKVANADFFDQHRMP